MTYSVNDQKECVYDHEILTKDLMQVRLESITMKDKSFFEENKIIVYDSNKVETIDQTQKLIYFENQKVKLTYDKLLISTGSKAFLPSVEGINHGGGKIQIT